VLGAHLPRRQNGGWRAEFTQRTATTAAQRCPARIRVCGFSGRRRPCCARCPRLSYQSTKKARCGCDTGLSVFFGRIGTAKCHVRNG
jgi:hypothetical protein